MSFFEIGDLVRGVDNGDRVEFCTCEVLQSFKNGNVRITVLSTELPGQGISLQPGQCITVHHTDIKLISQNVNSSTDDVGMTILKLSGRGE
jgi:hypothetical protein